MVFINLTFLFECMGLTGEENNNGEEYGAISIGFERGGGGGENIEGDRQVDCVGSW